MGFWGFFKKLGGWIGKALDAAGAKGLTEEVIKLAYDWAKVAAKQELDNAAKREFVVKVLVGKGIPESVARFATEAAVQILKKEVDKL